jgi:hypothetical protein
LRPRDEEDDADDAPADFDDDDEDEDEAAVLDSAHCPDENIGRGTSQ